MGTPAQPIVDPAAPPARAPENQDLARLQAQLNNSQEENKRLKQQQTAPPPNQPPSRDELEKVFWKEPLQMVDAIAKRAVWESEQRMTATTIDTQKQIARDKVREGDPETFDEYEVEIAAAVGGTPPQMHGSITVWQNAFNIVRGFHIDDITKKKLAKKEAATEGEPKVPVVSDGPAAPSRRAAPVPKEAPLSGEEKEVAKGLKLSDEEYRRGKDRYANQEKAWQEVVTFDSDDSRRATRAKAEKAAK